MLRRLGLFAALGLLGADAGQDTSRARMVAQVKAMAVSARSGPLNARVLDALRAVPRHEFVPRGLRPHAYRNEPLPIGQGQTISQPYIVAWMTALLKPRRTHRVLEVGTGSGYQAAILSRLVQYVYSIEIVPILARASAARLKRLGYANVIVQQGDGYAGWPAHAPFDAIIVTAGAPHIPAALVRQLRPGGRMVIPLGPPHGIQEMVLIEKSRGGAVARRNLGPVRFVPLTRASDPR